MYLRLWWGRDWDLVNFSIYMSTFFFFTIYSSLAHRSRQNTPIKQLLLHSFPHSPVEHLCNYISITKEKQSNLKGISVKIYKGIVKQKMLHWTLTSVRNWLHFLFQLHRESLCLSTWTQLGHNCRRANSKQSDINQWDEITYSNAELHAASFPVNPTWEQQTPWTRKATTCRSN